MRNSGDRTVKYLSDSFATAYDTGLWSECKVGTGTVSISSGELKLNTPANNDVAALVTTSPYNLRNCRISVSNVDVATSAPARAGVVIGKTKVTTSNPETINDSVRFYLDAVNSKYELKTDVGGTEKTIYTAAWTDGDGALKLDIEPDGFFTLYEDATVRRVGSLPLTATATKDIFHLYIYLYALGLAGTTGYGLLDNFQVDLDDAPTSDVSGSGVKKVALRENTPVWGRLIDQDNDGTEGADFFETDHAIGETPTQRIVLSRDVRQFQLEEVRYYMDSGNAATSRLLLYGDAQADDVHSLMVCPYDSAASLADSKRYVATVGNHMASGEGVQANDTILPVTLKLSRPGQVWLNQDWSAAPGNTQGFIVLKGREVE